MQSQKVSGRTYETETGLNGTLGVENKIIKDTIKLGGYKNNLSPPPI